jgi:predicted dehydrogenase/kynurenine formamidase
LLIGTGYFSDFHLDAWQRTPNVEIVSVCDLNRGKAQQAADKYGIPAVFSHIQLALKQDDLDFVDIATPPTGRLEIVRQVVERGLPMICQKPLAQNYSEARQIINLVLASQQNFMVHENFRFQPWYREIKQLLDCGTIGNRLHTIHMRTRMGDGWGDDAYLSRQPYFREMPRLLMHETGIHFVDTFRYLTGEVIGCSGSLRRLNEVIVGEDTGTFTLRFASGAVGVWDANRYNESLSDNPRYTFGELLVEANGGSLWMDTYGRIIVKPLGQPSYEHGYHPSKVGFAGDCVFACQNHFLEVLDGQATCETSPTEYLKSLQVIEAIYDSARSNRVVEMPAARKTQSKPTRRVIDLSLPINASMRGVAVRPAKSSEHDGWNATTLELYSHAGTHMDAPVHFLPSGPTLEQQDLSVCCGPARLVNLAPAAPGQLHTSHDIIQVLGDVYPGDRLLLRTDWHKRFGTSEYRDQLPRISIELAQWLVDRGVAMIGVEPPSVADVNNLQELTEVHQALFRGGILIVEGLAYLDKLTSDEVEFIALPLRIVGGDGCPVRAVAIEYSEAVR